MRITSLRLLPLVFLALAGCDTVKDTLGFQHTTPDEFAVATAPPLAIPPDYTLRPPQPGMAPSQSVPAQTQAQAMLIGDSTNPGAANRAAAPAGTSGGEAALLQQAGSVPQVQTTTSNDTATAETTLSNPEQARLETALFGAPVGGNAAPVITMSSSSIFSGLF